MFEKLTKRQKLGKARELFTAAEGADINWQREARDDFNFRDGNQWTNEEKAVLTEELRPILTFNLTKASVDLIMGMNEDNRIIHRASPIEPTDSFLSEVLNDISDWVQETNDFDAEEDNALESAAICGRGFVGIDFMPDPEKFGEVILTEIDIPVNEVHLDPSGRRDSLEDHSYITWDRWMTREDFNIRYPKVSQKKIEEILDSGARVTLQGGDMSQAIYEENMDNWVDDSDYDKPIGVEFFDKTKNMIRVVHMEYWETYTRYFVFDPTAGDFQEAPEKPTKEIKAAFLQEFGEEMTVETLQDKRVKWFQFAGNNILYDDLSPLPYKGFSIVPVFTYKDVSKRTNNHFGIVRLMKDPQREVNKRWSQALNMLNQQVQPGLYAETEAFVDDEQAERSLKEAGSVTYVNAGTLQQGRIQERTVPTFPAAPMQMEEFSQDIMKKITGINPDLMGQDRGRQEPGVVVRLRQQQGMTLLKPLFKGYNQMKKELFKRKLAIIMAYMPDKQVLRILGQNDRYQISPEGLIIDQANELVANFRDVRELEYNIAAEESPGNMSKRMLEMTALMEMRQQQFPVDPLQIIEKMELPASEKQRWIQYIEQQQKAQSEQQQMMLQLETQMKEREISNDEQKTMNDMILGIAKINQASEKDTKKQLTDFLQLEQDEQIAILDFAAKMAQIAQQAKAAEAAKKQADKTITPSKGGKK
jgi:hypothetical protein